jgi:hypothetical protein
MERVIPFGGAVADKSIDMQDLCLGSCTGLASLEALCGLSALERLDLSGGRWAVQDVSFLTGLGNIRTLRLENCKVRTSELSAGELHAMLSRAGC